jgi:hypothetical protein
MSLIDLVGERCFPFAERSNTLVVLPQGCACLLQMLEGNQQFSCFPDIGAIFDLTFLA